MHSEGVFGFAGDESYAAWTWSCYLMATIDIIVERIEHAVAAVGEKDDGTEIQAYHTIITSTE